MAHRHQPTDQTGARKTYPQVPPKVEHCLTERGQALCPALDALLKWAEKEEALQPREEPEQETTD
ncbi:winged helix-turn-helix transcriptional regulator [Chromohalobacter beijerinckii]|uniref:winged helix-turn-helix transcriptional regulator n=1 Tax=Chromohalobacter beijerinckii TaxID=86179 RepID=UPI00248B9E65|nr:winged helix-turn-helix transcriptional regulator [Chromohalobacter beijerinckii]